MAVYDRIPETNFTWDDIRDTLNNNGSSVVNNDALSAFDNRSNLNKWSKYKPVIHSFLFDRPSDWYKGSDKKCGLNYIAHSTLASMINSIDAGVDQYPYNRPTIGNALRTDDFSGYNPKAIPPVIGTSGTVEIPEGQPLGVSAEVTGNSDLSFADIFGYHYAQLYFGIAVRSGNSFNMITADANIITSSGAGFLAFLSGNNFKIPGMYKVYQFMTSAKQTSEGVNSQVGVFIAMPETQILNVKVVSSASTVKWIWSINCNWNNGTITGDVQCRNEGEDTDFGIVRLRMRYDTSNPDSPLIAGEREITIGTDVKVAKGETKTYSVYEVSVLPNLSELVSGLLTLTATKTKDPILVVGDVTAH